jgi:hypothetical protein
MIDVGVEMGVIGDQSRVRIHDENAVFLALILKCLRGPIGRAALRDFVSESAHERARQQY